MEQHLQARHWVGFVRYKDEREMIHVCRYGDSYIFYQFGDIHTDAGISQGDEEGQTE